VALDYRLGHPRIERELRRLATRVLARLRPSMPPIAWEGILAARSFASRGPVVLRPTAARAMVLAPHPDDETLGCGGTLALLHRRGCTLRVLVATSGEGSVVARGHSPADLAAIRRAEAIAACRVLGTDSPDFLNFPDGQLTEQIDNLTARLIKEIAAFDPQIIFLPWPLDGHPDHQVLPMALASVDLAQGTQIWTYEVWTPLPANRIVDVSAVWDVKKRALACHASGHEGFDLTAHLALQRWRSVFGLEGQGHAEAFLVLDPPALRSLVEQCRG
jgi:LmbE family N-acetylglucosaminyl deacetylase